MQGRRGAATGHDELELCSADTLLIFIFPLFIFTFFCKFFVYCNILHKCNTIVFCSDRGPRPFENWIPVLWSSEKARQKGKFTFFIFFAFTEM